MRIHSEATTYIHLIWGYSSCLAGYESGVAVRASLGVTVEGLESMPEDLILCR